MHETNNLVVLNQDNIPTTTSLKVAETFEREHSKILKSIKSLECSEEFNEANFGLVEYQDKKGEIRPMYNITRDGFVFLAMGFTGKRAAAFKEKYISAFNQMDKTLREMQEGKFLYNAQNQDEVLSKPQFAEISFRVKHAMNIARSFGFSLQYAREKANNAVKKATGVDPLKLLDAESSAGLVKTIKQSEHSELNDLVNEFFQVYCEEVGGVLTPAAKIYKAFCTFLIQDKGYNSYQLPSMASVGRILGLYFKKKKSTGGKFHYFGLALKVEGVRK